MASTLSASRFHNEDAALSTGQREGLREFRKQIAPEARACRRSLSSRASR